jgi:hypothetical protein
VLRFQWRLGLAHHAEFFFAAWLSPLACGSVVILP